MSVRVGIEQKQQKEELDAMMYCITAREVTVSVVLFWFVHSFDLKMKSPFKLGKAVRQTRLTE